MTTARRIIITITSPQGTTIDITSATELNSLGNISVSPESDLGILSHGDMAMTLNDPAGELESFFEGATPTDIYTLSVVREREDGSEWDRVFGGVLDLPYSLSYDDVTKRVHLVVYSYSKQLERTPADGTAGPTTVIRRALSSKTATINVGTPLLQFLAGETADLAVGDVVRLSDGQKTEDFTIDRIISTTDAAATNPAAGTYASAYAEVVTPFYHDIGPTALLQKIADEAGVEFNDFALNTPLASFPIATPLSIAGLNLTGVPRSLVPVAGLLNTSFIGYGGFKKGLANPTATWTEPEGLGTPYLDWTPYHNSQPTPIASVPAAGSLANLPDVGIYAPDHINNNFFMTEGSGVAAAHLWRGTGGVWFDTDLGVSSTIIAPFLLACCVVDPLATGVYMSYRNSAGSKEFRYWNGAFATISTAVSGGLMILRYPSGPGSRLLVMFDDITKNILLWNLPGRTLGRTIPWMNSTDRFLPWTARCWGDTTVAGAASKRWFTFLFERYGETWVGIYDARGTYSNWSFVAAYRVSSLLSPATANNTLLFPAVQSYQTVMKTSAGEEYAVGYAGGEWFVLSTDYTGVIRYADFKDSSCAKAARDVATVINAVVNFDAFGVMTVRKRKMLGTGDPVMDLGVPLASTRHPISDLYRSSVTVNGTLSSGGAINETQGASGDSARRLTISSDLITTPGMALACALTTLQFVSQIREQRDVTVIDDGTPLEIFDRVTMGGKTWVVYKLETDIEQKVRMMTLLDLEP